MGGRGTFAAGNSVDYTYKTTKTVNGPLGPVKVLKGIGNKHALPEESHSSNAYIKLRPNGIFHEMRIYDSDHYLAKEIAFHIEPKIDPSRKPVLHVHEYKRDNFSDRQARPITKSEYNLYKPYFLGVPEIEKW